MTSELIPSGRSLLDPKMLVERAGIGPGMMVGDFGVGGEAYFGVQAAKLIGTRGMVFAFDIYKPALSSALSAAKLSGCHNMKTVWSDLERYGGARTIRDGALDFGIMVNVLHGSKQQKEMLRECTRMLKAGSRMLVIEWANAGLKFGPKEQQLLPEARLLDLGLQAGLAPFEQFAAGPHHYAVVFVKAG